MPVLYEEKPVKLFFINEYRQQFQVIVHNLEGRISSAFLIPSQIGAIITPQLINQVRKKLRDLGYEKKIQYIDPYSLN